MQDLPVKEIMSTAIVTVNANASLSRVAAIFKDHSFHHIPIVDDEGCIAGMISSSDLDRAQAGVSLFRNPNKEAYTDTLFSTMRACDIMTKDVTELQPTDTIRRAYHIFRENKFRSLPIVDRGKLVGILTPLDILDYFFEVKQ